MEHTEVEAQDPAPGDAAGGAPDATLSIGDLAGLTGVSAAVLRTWETRHGFPVAQRLPSGHRRYREADVDLVRQVVRRRDSGIRLETAIAEAAATQPPTSPSIYAELRRRHPQLATYRLRKSTLMALSWAIEDECCAVADRPVLFGSFQRAAFYQASASRWTELSRVARTAIVFADEWPDTADEARGPIRAALPEDAPMRREWAVVCDAADSTACLTSWELPGQSEVPDRQRIFEAVWTVDPEAVRDAARAAAAIAESSGVLAARPLLYELAEAPAPRTVTPSGVTALFNRVVAYVDRLGH